jgi:hypothetical protein
VGLYGNQSDTYTSVFFCSMGAYLVELATEGPQPVIDAASVGPINSSSKLFQAK